MGVFLCLSLAAIRGQQIDYANDAAVADYVRPMLYCWPRPYPTNLNEAAFRYKCLVYTNEAGQVRADFDHLSRCYDADALQKSKAAEAVIAVGLRRNPGSSLLGNLLLDVYYDRAVAEAIKARKALAEADFIRFSLPPAPPAFLIDNEIAAYVRALDAARSALHSYLGLLTNHFGLSRDPGTPLGYSLLQRLGPARGLEPATWLRAGEIVPVVESAGPLFAGHKDLVLLCELLRDYGRTARELARLRLCRGGGSDAAEAASGLCEGERFVILHSALLRGLLPELHASDGDRSGLAEAISGCAQILDEFGTLRQVLVGKRNVLGFEPDFLMFVNRLPGGEAYFDSYDAIRDYLRPSNVDGPLHDAKTDWQEAREAHEAYRGYEDQFAIQFRGLTDSSRKRLFAIVGALPGQPAYSTPEKNEGSEIWQQLNSIEAAKLRIQRNHAQISNIQREIEIELWRAGAVADTVIRFAGQRASITEWIGHLNAVQAGANALAQGANAASLLGLAAHGANAVAQAAGEEAKGRLEAEKERQAALEHAEIEGIESGARIKTLLLNLSTLAVDSQEATLLLKQEIGRLAALQREKESLERGLAESREELAQRYFADPSHRIRKQNGMLVASLSFNEAQKWLYFMARALEYKWNTAFKFPYGGRDWSSLSVFKLRSAAELEDMWRAMNDYDANASGYEKHLEDDRFSLREDFFGYVGGANSYIDVVTGESLDATNAFRRRLVRLQDESGVIAIRFSTVRELPGYPFFLGPRFNPDGSVWSKGYFLDKIVSLKINLPGRHSLGRTELVGDLAYGGTAYIRNAEVGRFLPSRRDRLAGEFTAYSSRCWFFHLPTSTWRSNPELSSPVTMALTGVAGIEPPGNAIDVFQERSVATSEWTLMIPTKDAMQNHFLRIDELDDVEIYFKHNVVARP